MDEFKYPGHGTSVLQDLMFAITKFFALCGRITCSESFHGVCSGGSDLLSSVYRPTVPPNSSSCKRYLYFYVSSFENRSNPVFQQQFCYHCLNFSS